MNIKIRIYNLKDKFQDAKMKYVVKIQILVGNIEMTCRQKHTNDPEMIF